MIEGACSIADLDVRTLQELEKLGPFGPGNPEPVFTFRASVRSHSVIKGRHLKMSLTSASGAAGRTPQTGASRAYIEAIWFHAAEHQGSLSEFFSEETEWAGVPELNRFRGNVTPNFRVRDWRRV
jgi:single-stranded DNA-specific DHH superfamily exonuclease